MSGRPLSQRATLLQPSERATFALYGPKGIDLGSGVARGYIPTFTKPLTSPIMTIANQSLTSMQWPWLIEVDDIFGGLGPYGERYRIYYSTDHSTSSTASGIGLLTAADILGPWTDRGKVFVDSTGGNQTEKPAVVWVPETQTFHLYYSQVAATGATWGQVIKLATMSLATAMTGDAWTITTAVPNGIVLDSPAPWDGNGWVTNSGAGYGRLWRFGKRWFATHLIAGTNWSRSALSTSVDGITWRTDPRPLAYHAHLVPPGHAFGTGLNPIMWNGQRWFCGIIGTFFSGGAASQGVYAMAPVAANWRQMLSEPSIMFGRTQTWETDAGASPLGPNYLDVRGGGSAIVGKDGKIYVVYSGTGAADLNNGTKAAAGAFGIAVGS